MNEALRLIRRSIAARLETFSYNSRRPMDKVFQTMLLEMTDLTKLSVRNTALPTSTLKLLSNPAICLRLSSLYNKLYKSKKEPHHLGENDVLQLINARCCKRRIATSSRTTRGKRCLRTYGSALQTHKWGIQRGRGSRWEGTKLCEGTCFAPASILRN